MKLATWNVNSVRARLERVIAWVEENNPDVLCLQETKCVEEQFPLAEFTSLGYRASIFGQKKYNGVAILTRVPQEDVVRGIGDDFEMEQARLISATIAGVRVLNAYFPNGQIVGSEKFEYKLGWMKSLREMIFQRYRPDQPIVLCGDFNVFLNDSDAKTPRRWDGSVLSVPQVRDELEKLRQLGFVDVFRKINPAGGLFSWWDYRRLSFANDDGLRLDHVYATEPLAEKTSSATIDRQERKGIKPSDHAPVIVEFS